MEKASVGRKPLQGKRILNLYWNLKIFYHCLLIITVLFNWNLCKVLGKRYKTDINYINNINKKVTSNKKNHVEGEKKLNELLEKVKLLFYAVHNIRAWTIFKQKRPSGNKKELHVNPTLNTFQRKHESFDLSQNLG